MEKSKSSIKKIVFIVFAAVLLYCGLMQVDRVISIFNFFKKMLSPFIIGGVIAFILNVPMRMFERWLGFVKHNGFRRILAITATLLFIALILTLVFVLLIPEIKDAILDLIPALDQFFRVDMANYFSDLFDKYPQLKEKLFDYFKDINFSNLIPQAASFLTSSLGVFVNGLSSIVSFLSSFFIDVFVAVVFTVYCLSQKEVLSKQGKKVLYAFFKESTADYIVRTLRLTNEAFSNFLSGQCLEVVILGSMFAISMAIFRMDYIALVSVLIAVTAFIPIVGAWIGCVVGAFLMLVSNPIDCLWFLLLFIVLQQIENHLIYPKVVGNSIGLSGMWVLIAVAVGGALFGVAGMFLMIPLTSVFYTLFGEYTNKRLAEKNLPAEKLEPSPSLSRRRLKKAKDKPDSNSENESKSK